MAALGALALLTHCGNGPESDASAQSPEALGPPVLGPPGFLPPVDSPLQEPLPPLGPPVDFGGEAAKALTRWTRQEGGTGQEKLHALATDAAGGFVVAGLFGDAPFPGGTGFALARHAADGTPEWTRQVTTESVQARAVAVTTSGAIFVVGSYDGAPDLGRGRLPAVPPGGRMGLFLAHFSRQGQLDWSRGFVATNTFNESGTLEHWPVTPEAIATDAAGELVVVGQFHGRVSLGGPVLFAGLASIFGPEPYPGGFIAKFDGTGRPRWSRAIEGRPAETVARLRAVAVARDGEVLVGGRVSAGANLGDGVLARSAPFIARYDVVGRLQWKRLLLGDGTVHGEVNALRMLDSGDVAFTANLGGRFPFQGSTYLGGEPEDQGYSGNLNGFTGTLRARGEDGWLLDVKRSWMLGLAVTSTGEHTVTGVGHALLLDRHPLRSPRDEPLTPFVARFRPGGSHAWSLALDSRFTGVAPTARLQLAACPGDRVLLGGDFEAPVLQAGRTYTPRGASDLFFLQLGPTGTR